MGGLFGTALASNDPSSCSSWEPAGQVRVYPYRAEEAEASRPDNNEFLPTMSHPDSKSDPIGGSEPSSGCETQDWDSLPDFFFKTELVPVGMAHIL